MEAALHYFVDADAEVFGGRDFFGEFRQRVQILMVVAGEHFPFDKAIEIDQIADHAGLFVDWAAYGDLERVVVSVAVGVVAFAVDGLIFGFGHGIAVQTMRGGEQIAA